MSNPAIAPYLHEDYWHGQMLLNGAVEPNPTDFDLTSIGGARRSMANYLLQGGSKVSLTTYRDNHEWVAAEQNPGTIVVIHEEGLWLNGELTAEQLHELRGDSTPGVREIYSRPPEEITATAGHATLTYRRRTALGVVALGKKGQHRFYTAPEADVSTDDHGRMHLAAFHLEPAELTVGATYHYGDKNPEDDSDSVERLQRINLIEVVSAGTPKTAKAKGGLALFAKLITSPSGS
ncbi:MAG TPA: hypothetical protein VLI54_01685 [Bacillota bacterium]|nr:hypothetical protein [Bacillota bacterium]